MPTARERLLTMAESMPDGSSVTLSRDSLLEALSGPNPAHPEPEPSPNGDRLLTVKEVAERLGVSNRWVYDNADSLPFTRRIKRGMVRFSEKGLNMYLSKKR